VLLRRITEHVKAQNWTAVAIDFAIVVIGVFMGIQLGDWNERRKSQTAAGEYHARLVSDIELSAARNGDQLTNGEREIEQLDLIVAALGQCSLNEKDQAVFAAGLYNMGKFDLPIMVMGTIDELNATGNFPLIGSPNLRRMIAETVRDYQTKLAINPQITGRTIPSINYVRTRVRFSLDQHQPRLSSIDSDKVQYDFEAICKDTSFVHAIATVREMSLASIGLNKDMLEHQQVLLAELQGQ